MPRASIIIPTRTRPQLLRRAIASAQAAGTDVEVIVVDDASQDETRDVCFASSNIVYVRLERNQGVAGARNVGILASKGEYISFLDDDDMRLPGSIDLQIQRLESEPRAGLVYGQARLADEKGNPTSRTTPRQCQDGDIFWELLERNFMPCGSVVFRRSCLTRVGLLDNVIAGIDDWDLWIRITELYSAVVLERPVMIYREGAPASGQGTSQAAKIVKMSTRQFKNWMDLPRAVAGSGKARRLAASHFSQNMAKHLVRDTGRALARGKPLCAVKDLACLVRLHVRGFAEMICHRTAGFVHSSLAVWSPASPEVDRK